MPRDVVREGSCAYLEEGTLQAKKSAAQRLRGEVHLVCMRSKKPAQ